jgi:hypothetical protein
MKSSSRIYFILIFLLSGFSSSLFSQNIIWQKCFGGTDFDYAYSSIETSEGGFIICGSTSSLDGEVTGIHEGSDIWIEKVDADGNLIWQKCLGGNGMDNGRTIQHTSDGNFIIAGSTNSTNGDISGNHGDYDAWIIKIDTSGNIIWQKCLGGTGIDEAYSIELTSDNGYFITGTTNSNDGDITGNHGAFDFWIIKIDSNGDFMWQKCLGGSAEDFAHYGVQTKDNGYIITGLTRSTDGEVTGNHGNDDLWTVKLDSNMEIAWQKCFGGSAEDGGTKIQQTADGGFIQLGHTASNDGDVYGNIGSDDFWFVKLNSAGEISWQKCYGTIYMDWPYSLEITPDGGYLGAGTAGYNTGGGCAGDFNGWIVKLDSDGNSVWEKSLGGAAAEEIHSVRQTSDGGYFAAGFTFSDDEIIQGNHGLSDCLAVKLTGTLNAPAIATATNISVTPITFTITAKPGSTIYYTTDGSSPDPESSQNGPSPLILATPGTPGTYIYKAMAVETDWNSSEVTSISLTIVPTGIQENQDNASQIIIYPNPAENFVIINASEFSEATIMLLNVEGKPIFNKRLVTGYSLIDITSYTRGIYFFSIKGKLMESGNLIEKTISVVFK